MAYLTGQMRRVVFATPDPEGSAMDLVNLVGLKITERNAGHVMLSSDELRREVAFVRAPEVGVGLEGTDVREIAVGGLGVFINPTEDGAVDGGTPE